MSSWATRKVLQDYNRAFIHRHNTSLTLIFIFLLILPSLLALLAPLPALWAGASWHSQLSLAASQLWIFSAANPGAAALLDEGSYMYIRQNFVILGAVWGLILPGLPSASRDSEEVTGLVLWCRCLPRESCSASHTSHQALQDCETGGTCPFSSCFNTVLANYIQDKGIT